MRLGARPGQAIALSAVFNMLGALLIGTAVADTIAGIVTVAPSRAVAVIGSGVLSAAVWNLLTWWRGLLSSSGHALVGGLVGSAVAEAGIHAVQWGGLDGWKPVGVFGALIALALSPPAGLAFGFVAVRLNARLLRRASRRVYAPIRGAEWAMSAGLSFSHGANDAQKAMGVIAALLLASGHIHTLSVPFWTKLACGASLTLGTAMGGGGSFARSGRTHLPSGADRRTCEPELLQGCDPGRVLRRRAGIHDPGCRIIGGRRGRRRRRTRHVRWAVVRSMGFAWLMTLPATGVLGRLRCSSGGRSDDPKAMVSPADTRRGRNAPPNRWRSR